MDTYTIMTAFLIIALAYRLMELLVEIIIGFVVIVALLMICLGVCDRRRKKSEYGEINKER